MRRAPSFAALVPVAAFQALALAPAHAGSPNEPPLVEEFFFTESAHPQAKGELQVTWSVHHRRYDGSSFTDASLLLEYGIAGWLEVEAELPWLRRRVPGSGAVTGLGNVELSVLVPLRRHPGLFISAGVEIGLPTASSSLRLEDGEVEFEPFVVAGRRFARSELQVAFSSGFEQSDLGWDVAYVHAIARWRGVLELNGRSRVGSDSLQLTPGAYWKPTPSYEVGLALPVALRDGPRLGAMVKITAEF